MQKTYVLEERLSQNELKNLLEIPKKILSFAEGHSGKILTLITSGGTSVPLEKRSVRFLQNFSTGLRGSLLAEALLKQGEPVIFFYRLNSHLPFSKGLRINDILLEESSTNMKKLEQGIAKMKQYKPLLLLLPFQSIYYYLNGVKIIKEALPKQSRLILCAAVSDFLPEEVASHKIQTAQHLSLNLISSPKMLGELSGQDHLCTSFKLETDVNKLKQRVTFAIEKYGVDMVVGNCLLEKQWVKISYNEKIFPNKECELYQNENQGEVESFIISKVIEAHKLKFQSK